MAIIFSKEMPVSYLAYSEGLVFRELPSLTVWLGTTVDKEGDLLGPEEVMHLLYQAQSHQDVGYVIQPTTATPAWRLEAFRLRIFYQNRTGHVQTHPSICFLNWE